MTHPALVPPLAIERYRVLEPHLADGIPLADLARTGTLSERTLQRWLGRYRAEGLAGLARLPRNDRGRLHLPEHLVELTRTLATKRPRPPVAAIHRKVQELAIAHGHRTPSYAAVARVVRAIPASQIAAASDPAVYRDQHELVHRREAATSNEMWQADHTVLDILVLDDAGTPVRPWLTVIVDDHSRAIAGYFLSLDAPSALNTALALRQAIWRKPNPEWIVSGIPEQLYVDNGSDFISEHIEQACIALKIRLIHSLPGRPRGRGKIERLFRTINDMFLPAMPDSLEQLDMLLVHVPKPRKVLRDGIRLMGRRYVEPTLAAFVGEQVEAVYDPRDLTEIHVYHQGRFVCRALSSEHAGHPSLRAIQRARRGAKERDKQVPAPTETFDGDQEDTASRPTTYRGLRLYAADD